LRAVGAGDDGQVRAMLQRAERPGASHLFVLRAGDGALQSTTGQPVGSTRILDAVVRRDRAVRIPREEASAFGLPARTAVAGIAYPADPRGLDVIVVSSAEHQRDRQAWARRRLLLSVAAAAGLVLLFGGVALRMQRKELLLESELAVAALRRQRDAQLEGASK